MIGKKLAGVCLALVALLIPQRAFGQATVNPTKAVFDQSPDHNATNGDGTPVVASYQLAFYLVGASAPFQTNNLGKPTPNGTGTITVDLTSMLVGWPVPGTNYFAEVKAVGAGGTSAGAQSNQFSFSAPCSYSISPTSQTVVSSANSASVSVTAPTGCTWTAVSNTTWITVTSSVAGAGNGTVGYSVAANGLTSPRTGTVLIAGQTFTITQNAAPCTYSISPTSQSVVAAGATATTAVTTTSGCNWTSTSNASWITVTSGSSGSGNGTVGYSVAANALTSPRSGTLTIAGQPLTVNQAAAACSYTLSSTTENIAAAGGPLTTSVTAQAGCSWTTTSNSTWISIASGGSGSGNGTVAYDVAANTATIPRTGSLTVAGQTVSVMQSELCVFTLSSTSQSVPSTGATRTTTVTTTSGCSWTAVSNSSWVTVTSGSSGTGSGTVTYVIAANTGVPRTATLTIAGQTVTINEQSITAIPSAPTNLVLRP